MVKKVKKTAGSAPAAEAAPAGPGLLDSQFGQLVKESAQQIWSAGLAAFAKAQNNSGKAFDSLAEEGARIQKKTQASTEERLGAVASRMSDMAGEVGTRAGQHWDKLESIFEDRVARALNRLGVPSAQDVAALHARLDALTQALQAQGGQGPAAGVAPAAAVAKATRRNVNAPTPSTNAAKPVKAAKAAKTTQAAGAKSSGARQAPSKSDSKASVGKAPTKAAAKSATRAASSQTAPGKKSAPRTKR
jgi:poly(hydroxyalkanoate) granule-associated protein